MSIGGGAAGRCGGSSMSKLVRVRVGPRDREVGVRVTSLVGNRLRARVAVRSGSAQGTPGMCPRPMNAAQGRAAFVRGRGRVR